ncbi:MAG: hypothetical protein ACYSWP_20615 [Planctomycetota bacterium]
MKLSFEKILLVLLVGIIFVCSSCGPDQAEVTEKEPLVKQPVEAVPEEPVKVEVPPVEEKVVPVEPKPEPPEVKEPVVEKPVEVKPVVAKPVATEPVVVATIEDYEITDKDVELRLMRELAGTPERYVPLVYPTNSETVVKKLLAEKAMIIEGRKKGLVKENTSIQRFKQSQLLNVLYQREILPKIKYSEAEIAEAMKSDPKLDRDGAINKVRSAKGRKFADQYYKDLYVKRKVEKVTYNFGKATQIHQRLLLKPKEARSGFWIKNSQIKNELTQEEKDIVLAKFVGGEVTLLDWFNAINEMSPPKRPKDLGTKEGVERLLDGAIRTPLMVTEAKSLGFDKDPEYIKMIRAREDRRLPGMVMREKLKEFPETTKEELKKFYEEHKEELGTPDSVKIDVIWCENEDAGLAVRDALDNGEDFEAVKQKYGLLKKKTVVNITSHDDRLFFDRIWESSDDIEGPFKGIYKGGKVLKWRVVKILDRTEGKLKEYDKGVERSIKRRISHDRREAVLSKYIEELSKYEHKIYMDKVRAIDPLDIP